MQIIVSSTTKVVEVNGVLARIWEGFTDTGIPVHCYVTRIATPEGQPEKVYGAFEAELEKCDKPSAVVDAIPLRLIL